MVLENERWTLGRLHSGTHRRCLSQWQRKWSCSFSISVCNGGEIEGKTISLGAFRSSYEGPPGGVREMVIRSSQQEWGWPLTQLDGELVLVIKKVDKPTKSSCVNLLSWVLCCYDYHCCRSLSIVKGRTARHEVWLACTQCRTVKSHNWGTRDAV